MPIYEYRCRACGKVTSIITLSAGAEAAVVCKACGGEELTKMVSRVAIVKSEEARLESLMDPSKLSGLDENDPVGMARWMKRMGKEMGEEVDNSELDQLVEEAAHEAEGGGPGGAAADPGFAGGGPDD